jgi:hypothetical protein
MPAFAQQQPQPAAPKVGGPRDLDQNRDPNPPAAIPLRLEPPGLEVLAESVQSDASLQERIRQENRERPTGLERITFPVDPVLSRDTYHGRKWDPMRLEVAPYYVCHGRLPLQQINFERYGWDLGIIQPVICTGLFLFDVAMLPYELAKEPCRCFEYNTGWCLPGDPVPLLLYPPELSATGFAAEVATIVTLVVVFP